MREIKFRAWDKHTKKMIQSENLYRLSQKEDGIFAVEGCIGKVPITTFHKDLVLMQFAGLHDKKGKEIYEGDILLNDDDCDTLPGEKFIVKWLPGHFVAGGVLGAGDHIGEDCEVIGDIHTTPELLGENKDE